LWYGPGVLAVLGLIALGVHLSGRNKTPETEPTPEELAVLRERLGAEPSKPTNDTDKA